MGSSSISSSKRRFAIKLIVFLALLFVLDAGLGELLELFYFKQISGLNYRLTHAMDHSTEDVIILGSSRAQAHYVPSVIKETLGRSCYNAGQDGQNFLFSYAVQQAVLARYQPDILILDLIPRDFFKRDFHYDRLAVLLPYYASHEEIRPIIHLRSRYEWLKLYSRIYPYNSLPLQIVKYNLVNDKDYDGHVPVFGEMTPLMISEQEHEIADWQVAGLDPTMFQSFETMVASCEKAGIKLFVVISPHYQGELPGLSSLGRIREILADSPYELWDYSNHPDFAHNTKLFRDITHLNSGGAIKFTRMVAERISTTLESEIN